MSISLALILLLHFFSINPSAMAQELKCKLANSVVLDFGDSVPDFTSTEPDEFGRRNKNKGRFIPELRFKSDNSGDSVYASINGKFGFGVKWNKATQAWSCDSNACKGDLSKPQPILGMVSKDGEVKAMGYLMAQGKDLIICGVAPVGEGGRTSTPEKFKLRQERPMADSPKLQAILDAHYSPACEGLSYRFSVESKYLYAAVTGTSFLKKYKGMSKDEAQQGQVQIDIPNESISSQQEEAIEFKKYKSLVSDCSGIRNPISENPQVPGFYGSPDNAGAKTNR